MTNAEIAAVFEQMADLLEFQGDNPFRVRAYRNAARAIRDLGESVAAIVADNPERLLEIDGIGKEVAEKTARWSRPAACRSWRNCWPRSPRACWPCCGFRASGRRKPPLFHELGIKTLDELRAACEAGRVRELKGFGAKTEQRSCTGIAHRRRGQPTHVLGRGRPDRPGTCASICRPAAASEQLELAGSYRRGKDTVGDLDLLVVAGDAGGVMDRFGRVSRRRPKCWPAATPRCRSGWHAGFQVDLRIVPAESFGAALQYFTGSKDHNVVLRGLAKQRGLKINEYGVFRVDGERETYRRRSHRGGSLRGAGPAVFPPELREARHEFDWAEAGQLPELIELDDIRGDLHMHTTETDGRARSRRWSRPPRPAA